MNAGTTLCVHGKLFKKSRLSKCFVDSKKSTISDSILLFVEKLYLDDPYKKIIIQYHHHSDLTKFWQDY